MDTIDLLLEAAEKSGLYGEAELKTGILAKKLGVSQQTISNELRRLEKEGLVERRPFHLGIKVLLTPNGRAFLEKYKERLDNAFKSPSRITGKVFSGFGEGRFYLMQKSYKTQFKDVLGFMPYEGTLNLKAEPFLAKQFLFGKKPLLIKGFKAKSRTFGQLSCYKVKIGSIKAAIVKPQRTHYKEDTIEIISSVYLRGALKLKDGDKVTITKVE